MAAKTKSLSVKPSILWVQPCPSPGRCPDGIRQPSRCTRKKASHVLIDMRRCLVYPWIKIASIRLRNFDIIVSGFAIHHQPDDRKRALYGEIYGLLKSGGLFLNLDQVSSASPSISEIFDSFFLDHIRSFHTMAVLNEAMLRIEAAYYQDKKENIPAPVESQCQWLRETGFQEVDCFFKTFELALFGGRKIS